MGTLTAILRIQNIYFLLVTDDDAFMDINSTIAAGSDSIPKSDSWSTQDSERFPLDERTVAISVVELAGALQEVS